MIEPVSDVSEKEAISTELAVIGLLDSAGFSTETILDEMAGAALLDGLAL